MDLKFKLYDSIVYFVYKFSTRRVYNINLYGYNISYFFVKSILVKYNMNYQFIKRKKRNCIMHKDIINIGQSLSIGI